MALRPLLRVYLADQQATDFLHAARLGPDSSTMELAAMSDLALDLFAPPGTYRALRSARAEALQQAGSRLALPRYGSGAKLRPEAGETAADARSPRCCSMTSSPLASRACRCA